MNVPSQTNRSRINSKVDSVSDTSIGMGMSAVINLSRYDSNIEGTYLDYLAKNKKQIESNKDPRSIKPILVVSGSDLESSFGFVSSPSNAQFAVVASGNHPRKLSGDGFTKYHTLHVDPPADIPAIQEESRLKSSLSSSNLTRGNSFIGSDINSIKPFYMPGMSLNRTKVKLHDGLQNEFIPGDLYMSIPRLASRGTVAGSLPASPVAKTVGTVSSPGTPSTRSGMRGTHPRYTSMTISKSAVEVTEEMSEMNSLLMVNDETSVASMTSEISFQDYLPTLLASTPPPLHQPPPISLFVGGN